MALSAGQSPRHKPNIPALQAKLSARLRQWMFAHVQYTAHGGATLIPRQHVVLSPGGGGIQKLQAQTGKGLRLLMILSSVVLLIACANFANLLLARGSCKTRRASRAHGTWRSPHAESCARSSPKAYCSASLAEQPVWSSPTLLSKMILLLAFPHARSMPVQPSPSLDRPRIRFPCLSAHGHRLRNSARLAIHLRRKPQKLFVPLARSTGERSSIAQKTLVVIQVALSIVLLSGAFLMSRSLANLQNQKLGIATDNRYVLRIDPKGAGYSLATSARTLPPD